MQRKKKLITLNFKTLKPYLPFSLLALTFVLGVLFGNLFVCKVDSLYLLSVDKLENLYSVKSSLNFLPMLKESLLSVLPFYILLFICGTSVVGTAITPFIILYNGFSYGLISGYLYSTYKLEGIMFSALILLPTTIIAVFGLLLLAKESIYFSYQIAGICIKSNRPINLYSDFKRFCANSGLTLILALISILFDLAMSALFIGYFNF